MRAVWTWQGRGYGYGGQCIVRLSGYGKHGKRLVLRTIPDWPGAAREADRLCEVFNAGGAARDRMLREAGL